MLKTLTLEAVEENLYDVIDAIEKEVDLVECASKMKNRVIVCVEEIFVNISKYAYAPQKGKVEIKYGLDESSNQFHIIFMDEGIKYNPLLKEDPDVSLSAEERPIGGLGIFISKKVVDDISYCYKDNMNILTLKVNL